MACLWTLAGSVIGSSGIVRSLVHLLQGFAIQEISCNFLAARKFIFRCKRESKPCFWEAEIANFVGFA